jgi:Tol biopolymer transport system component
MGRRLINTNLLHIRDIDWSPDGQQIAVVGKTDWYGDTEIYLLAADGSSLQRLTFLRTEELHCVSWSRTGQYLGFSTDTRIYHYELDLPRIRNLTPRDGLEYPCIEYSTQTDDILYRDQTVLWIMAGDGGDPRPLIKNLGSYSGLEMSPDGSKFALSIYRNQDQDIYIINIKERALLPFILEPTVDQEPSWSPDGDWIVFHRATGILSGDFFVIQTNGEGLKQITFHNQNQNQYKFQFNPIWSPLPGLEPGKGFTVTGLGAGVRLRTSHHLQGEILRQLKRGNEIVVLDGPVEEDDYLWFRVRVEGSQEEGWVIDNPGWWQPAGAGPVR